MEEKPTTGKPEVEPLERGRKPSISTLKDDVSAETYKRRADAHAKKGEYD